MLRISWNTEQGPMWYTYMDMHIYILMSHLPMLLCVHVEEGRNRGSEVNHEQSELGHRIQDGNIMGPNTLVHQH